MFRWSGVDTDRLPHPKGSLVFELTGEIFTISVPISDRRNETEGSSIEEEEEEEEDRRRKSTNTITSNNTFAEIEIDIMRIVEVLKLAKE